MATQSFEKHGFRFVAGDIYTYCGSKGREWIAQRPGGGGWIRAMATHMPLRATRQEIVDRFHILGLFD